MLFSWFALIGTNAYSAEVSASASASVASLVSVKSAVVDSWGAAFMSEAIAGRRIMRIPRAGLPERASDRNADTLVYLTMVRDPREARFTLADFIKLIAGERILSGATISALTMSASDVTGFVSVTVAYN
jgi:hypothetical protein